MFKKVLVVILGITAITIGALNLKANPAAEAQQEITEASTEKNTELSVAEEPAKERKTVDIAELYKEQHPEQVKDEEDTETDAKMQEEVPEDTKDESVCVETEEPGEAEPVKEVWDEDTIEEPERSSSVDYEALFGPANLDPDTDNIYAIVEENSRKADSDENNYLHDLSNELAETGIMYFESKEDASLTADYYATRYSLLGQGSNLTMHYTGTPNEDGTYTHLLTVPTETDQNEKMRRIVKAIGTINQGRMNNFEYAETICYMAHDYFTYDGSCTSDSMMTALENRKGVCYHISHAAYVLLNYQGIPTRLVSGTNNGNKHVWLEATIDGVLYTLDPTNCNIYVGRPSSMVEQINH